jgi:RimJ/RimL family protein N-acetyltransferase
MRLETERLLLRPFETTDAPVLHELLSDPAVSGTLMNVDGPLTLADAERMIGGWQAAVAQGEALIFAVMRRANDTLVGYVDLALYPEHQRGEVAYWIGRPYWWQGYAAEAARRVVRCGFENLELNRIYARCLTRNEAAARVLEKAGLIYEGTHRQGAFKNGVFEDVAFYGVLRADYQPL